MHQHHYDQLAQAIEHLVQTLHKRDAEIASLQKQIATLQASQQHVLRLIDRADGELEKFMLEAIRAAPPAPSRRED